MLLLSLNKLVQMISGIQFVISGRRINLLCLNLSLKYTAILHRLLSLSFSLDLFFYRFTQTCHACLLAHQLLYLIFLMSDAQKLYRMLAPL
uniref:Uncharacterized protein n=1 Tax=Arundo donax TaxID=35708 RepID=A0A0A9GHL9_ARUDO